MFECEIACPAACPDIEVMSGYQHGREIRPLFSFYEEVPHKEESQISAL